MCRGRILARQWNGPSQRQSPQQPQCEPLAEPARARAADEAPQVFVRGIRLHVSPAEVRLAGIADAAELVPNLRLAIGSVGQKRVELTRPACLRASLPATRFAAMKSGLGHASHCSVPVVLVVSVFRVAAVLRLLKASIDPTPAGQAAPSSRV